MSKIICLLAGPACSGKVTQTQRLRENHSNEIVVPVSYTTRPERPLETDGVDYRFVDTAEFERIKKQGMVASIYYNCHRYGYPASAVEEAIASGKIVAMSTTRFGVEQVWEVYGHAQVLTFFLDVLPNEQIRRLRERGIHTEDLVSRLLAARYERHWANRQDGALIRVPIASLDATTEYIDRVVFGPDGIRWHARRSPLVV